MHYFLYVRLDGFYSAIEAARHQGAQGLVSCLAVEGKCRGEAGSSSRDRDRRRPTAPTPDRPNAGSLSAIVVHRDKKVLCASQAAKECGIETGMGVAEAKAILRDGSFVPWKEAEYRHAQEAWLDVCCEFSDVIEPADQHEAFIDLSGHPDPVAIALKLGQAVSSQADSRSGGQAGISTNHIPSTPDTEHHNTGTPPSLCASVPLSLCVEKSAPQSLAIGLASTKWIARIAASVIPNSKLQIPNCLREPLLDPAGYIAPLPVEMLLPASPEQRRRLRFLGYRTIGDVTKLSLATLKGQFGEDGLKIYQASWGGCFEPVRPLYPRDAIQERFSFDGPVESTEVLELGLNVLAKRLSKRLRDKDLQGSKLRLWIETERSPGNADLRSADAPYLERTFIKPMQGMRSILVGLKATASPSLFVADGLCRENEEGGRGVEQVGITAIRAQMPGLEKARRRQTELYGAFAEKAYGKETAISQVRQVFGGHAVQLASQVVEPRRKRLLKVWKDATGWR